MTKETTLLAVQFTQADLDRERNLGKIEGSYWAITGTCVISAVPLLHRELVTFLHLNTLGITPATRDELRGMALVVGFGLLVMGFQIFRLKRLNRAHAKLSAETGDADRYVALESREALRIKATGTLTRLRQTLTRYV